jgi:hypothetical protein
MRLNFFIALFRHLMVDVVVASSYGYHLGAVSKWATNANDELATAIHDFPIRGILVRSFLSGSLHRQILIRFHHVA